MHQPQSGGNNNNAPAQPAQRARSLAELVPNDSIDALKIFKELADNGYSWRRVLQESLFNPAAAQGPVWPQRSALEILIQKRDKLDERLFKEAVCKLFPERDANRYIVHSVIVRREEKLHPVNPDISLVYYTCCVYRGQVSETDSEKVLKETPHIEITIKAPGSRDLTSDIDTTISVQLVKPTHVNFDQVAWPIFCQDAVRDGKADIEFLIQCAVIHYFNEANRFHFQMTAGEHRDSNVYADGFMNSRGYPKHRDIPLLPGAIQEDVLKRMVTQCRQQQQQLELAASLVSLREYFSKTGKVWNTFKLKITTPWNNRHRDPELADINAEFRNNIENVFAILESLHDYKEQQMLTELATMDAYGNQAFTAQEQQLDKTVCAMNTLYEKHLLQVAVALGKFNRCSDSLRGKIQELQTAEAELNASIQAEQLQAQIANGPNVPEGVREAYRRLQTARIEAKRKVDSLKAIITDKTAELISSMIALQKAQVHANLFANEGYVNHSATFHVVSWLNYLDRGPNKRINKKQLVLGSILHQIGFRLLHVHEFKEKGASWGEVAYRVSKYGFRVADMMFGNVAEDFSDKRVFTLNEILQGLENGIVPPQAGQAPAAAPIPILVRLNGRGVVAGGQSPFQLADIHHNEYVLINGDMELQAAIKKNRIINVERKPYEADQLLRTWIYLEQHPGQDLSSPAVKALALRDVTEADIETKMRDIDSDTWINIAAKIIIATYAKKHENTQGFWGKRVLRRNAANNLAAGANQAGPPPAVPAPLPAGGAAPPGVAGALPAAHQQHQGGQQSPRPL